MKSAKNTNKQLNRNRITNTVKLTSILFGLVLRVKAYKYDTTTTLLKTLNDIVVWRLTIAVACVYFIFLSIRFCHTHGSLRIVFEIRMEREKKKKHTETKTLISHS